MRDLGFRTEDAIFGYRVAGVLVADGCVLLQSALNGPDGTRAYAFAGGHVRFGETSSQTVEREFGEELGMAVRGGPLLWVAEEFWQWDGRRGHSLCLYLRVEPVDTPAVVPGAAFAGPEDRHGTTDQRLFHWIPLDQVDELALYPPQTKDLLRRPLTGIAHFLHQE